MMKDDNQQTAPSTSLLDLPNDILRLILQFVGFENSYTVGETCKALNEFINSEPFLAQGIPSLTPEKIVFAGKENPRISQALLQNEVLSSNLKPCQMAEIINAEPELVAFLMQTPETADFLVKFAQKNQTLLEKMYDYPDVWGKLDVDSLKWLAKNHVDFLDLMVEKHPEKLADIDSGELTCLFGAKYKLVLMKDFTSQPEELYVRLSKDFIKYVVPGAQKSITSRISHADLEAVGCDVSIPEDLRCLGCGNWGNRVANNYYALTDKSWAELKKHILNIISKRGHTFETPSEQTFLKAIDCIPNFLGKLQHLNGIYGNYDTVDKKIVENPALWKKLSPGNLVALATKDPTIALPLIKGKCPGVLKKLKLEKKVQIAKNCPLAAELLFQKHKKTFWNKGALLIMLCEANNKVALQSLKTPKRFSDDEFSRLLSMLPEEALTWETFREVDVGFLSNAGFFKNFSNMFLQTFLMPTLYFVLIDALQAAKNGDKRTYWHNVQSLAKIMFCHTKDNVLQNAMENVLSSFPTDSNDLNLKAPQLINMLSQHNKNHNLWLEQAPDIIKRYSHQVVTDLIIKRSNVAEECLMGLYLSNPNPSCHDPFFPVNVLVMHYKLKTMSSALFVALMFRDTTKFELRLMADLPRSPEGAPLPEPGKLYVQLTNGAIQYKVLGSENIVINHQIASNSSDVGDFVIPDILDGSSVSDDPDFKKGILNITTRRGHTKTSAAIICDRIKKLSANNLDIVCQDFPMAIINSFLALPHHSVLRERFFSDIIYSICQKQPKVFSHLVSKRDFSKYFTASNLINLIKSWSLEDFNNFMTPENIMLFPENIRQSIINEHFVKVDKLIADNVLPCQQTESATQMTNVQKALSTYFNTKCKKRSNNNNDISESNVGPPTKKPRLS